MKERLTGAIILVAALVLLVPELLTGPTPKAGVKPAGADNAPLRSYTIDLADDAAGHASSAAPTSTAPTAVTEDPVATAKVEEEGESAGASQAASNEAAPEGGADAAANSAAGPAVADATSSAQEAEPAAGADHQAAGSAKPDAEADQPRSAFGPNAARVASAKRPATAGTTDAAPAKPAASTAAPSATPSSGSASSGSASSGWAVQLGVFASRDNAERLAKQVKGKGYAVVVNETSGAKRFYRVRVGPEKDRAAAEALRSRLLASGQKDAKVVPFP